MKKLFWIAIFLMVPYTVAAQTCPAGQVCLDQQTANRIFDQLGQLVAAKDAIAKLLAERGAGNDALVKALKTIDHLMELDQMNNKIILQLKDVIAINNQVIELYKKLVTDLEKQLLKPKSTWDKIFGILRRIGDIFLGIGIAAVAL